MGGLLSLPVSKKTRNPLVAILIRILFLLTDHTVLVAIAGGMLDARFAGK